MDDTNKTGDKSQDAGRRKTLTLKRNVEQGTVRQNFSHGRTKAVVVEKKKRRVVTPNDRGEGGRGRGGKGDPNNRTLTAGERDARAIALQEARQREVIDQQKRVEEEARRKVEEEARRKAEEEARVQAEAEARQKAEEEARRKTEEEAQAAKAPAKTEASAPAAEKPARDARGGDRAPGNRPARDGQARDGQSRGGDRPGGPRSDRGPRPGGGRPDQKPRTGAGGGRPGGPRPITPMEPIPPESEKPNQIKAVKRSPKAAEPAKPAKPSRTGGDGKQRAKLTVTNALDLDNERSRSLAAMRRRREKEKRAQQQNTPREKISREVVLPETITVQELGNRMSERAVDIVRLLMKQGQMAKVTDILDADTAELIASELGHTVKRVSDADVEEGLFAADDNDDTLEARPPVVTIMGHVDHGKTSLLDAVRNTNVVRGEAGGITQHIGAYQVEKNDQKITFIDTPGHAAFTAMRARGAQSTDIVILVVAADDGVMPQTIEAINHAKAAEVPIIVAVNKIDKPAADPSRVKTELLQHEVFVESMGGDVLEVEVSALQGTNLDKLLDAILLQSELLELKANPGRSAEGTVVEAKLDKGRGPVATVLVQRGTLNVGDIVVAGEQWGRVRALLDDQNNQVKVAEPSKPVEILGFNAAPEAGDRVAVVENEARAREITEYRQRKGRELSQARAHRGSLEQMLNQLKETGTQKFPILIKGDVQGSVEAIVGALEKLGNDEVQAQVIHSGVGAVTESDVTLAEASGAPILAFNVRANKQARDSADQSGIEVRYYNIIYDLTDDIKAAMSGLLSPERRETFIGYAEILEVFNITKVGKVAGCRVTEGTVERGSGVRLLRDNVVIHEGKLSTLKRFKDEVKEVVGGQECGMAFENYQDIRQGDMIECFRVEEIQRSL
ncbi:translation initiation factor IF-2 [Coralliovum pocilloporae]|uniref:translation initiation factor IF-2 n=1 Tax=Coralliovum pocilloporae TaxID=3066369 RepID=UPI003307C4EF